MQVPRAQLGPALLDTITTLPAHDLDPISADPTMPVPACSHVCPVSVWPRPLAESALLKLSVMAGTDAARVVAVMGEPVDVLPAASLT